MRPFQWGDGEALVRLTYETCAAKMIRDGGSLLGPIPWDKLPAQARSAWLLAVGLTALAYAERELE